MQLTVELTVSSDAFLCTELSSTFSQPSTKLFRFVSDRAFKCINIILSHFSTFAIAILLLETNYPQVRTHGWCHCVGNCATGQTDGETDGRIAYRLMPPYGGGIIIRRERVRLGAAPLKKSV